MAKSKHRKAHKQALALWKSIHAPRFPQEGAPVRVAKRAHEVRYPVDEDSVIVTVNGVTKEGTIDTDRGIITLGPNLTVQKGDRIKISHLMGQPDAPNKNGDIYTLEANPLRGASKFRMALDDAADFAPEPRHAPVDVDYTQVELRALAHLQNKEGWEALMGFATPEQIEAIKAGKFRAMSMGCTVDPLHCDRCNAPDAPKVGTGNHHLEMAWHKDENGKPVFDEISLCNGPDPNGLTTI